MELFLELGFTIAISLLFSFVLAKFLSAASATESEQESPLRPCADVIEKVSDDFGVEPKSDDLEGESRVGFLGKSADVDESEGVVIQGKLDMEDPVAENGGSTRTSGDEEIDEGEVFGEVGIAGIEECREKGACGGVYGCEGKVIDESPQRREVCEIEVESAKDEDGEVLNSGCSEEIEIEDEFAVDEVKDKVFDEDDDWEGIERTELERNFGAAVVFIGSRNNADQISNLNSDVQMQLYGLHKIATEGQCREAQPMALKVSARAKWNAWQQLGNMSPELAMEQYITLLSKSIPGLLQDYPGDTQ